MQPPSLLNFAGKLLLSHQSLAVTPPRAGVDGRPCPTISIVSVLLALPTLPLPFPPSPPSPPSFLHFPIESVKLQIGPSESIIQNDIFATLYAVEHY